MAAQHLDAVLLTSSDNVFYLSGVPLLSEWGRPMAAVITAAGKATLILAALEEENARTLSWIEDIRPYRDEEPASRLLLHLAGQVLSQERVEAGAIGLEEDVISLSLHRVLRERLPRARFATISPFSTSCV
jgi:Xaa-Pro aminopeptidase